jgi:outer membrane lipoprotein SlyB
MPDGVSAARPAGALVSSEDKGRSVAVRILMACIAVVSLVACAAAQVRPVLYPNQKMQEAGEAQARRDVDECIAKAERAGASGEEPNNVGRGAAQGAAIGGATAAVAGAIGGGGHALERAAQGAAVGATAGAVHGAFRPGGPDSIHRNFVQRCLKDLGYDVIGWK